MSRRATSRSASSRYAAKTNAPISANTTPRPSSVTPLHSSTISASPSSDSASATQTLRRTCSFSTAKAKMATSSGPRYWISSAIPIASRWMARK